MDSATKEQHPVVVSHTVDGCCSHLVHLSGQSVSLSPDFVFEAVDLCGVQFMIPIISSSDNKELRK